MVRWRETVLLFKEHEVEEIVEIGAGRVLTGFVKRIDRELPAPRSAPRPKPKR
jgi:[acyl-carrier-protein] S-malonyltransferase